MQINQNTQNLVPELEFEYRAVGGRFIWELMEDALSPKATSAAVDLGELKIVVFRPLDGATFVFLYTVTLPRPYVLPICDPSAHSPKRIFADT